jgi:hypothetical protein
VPTFFILDPCRLRARRPAGPPSVWAHAGGVWACAQPLGPFSRPSGREREGPRMKWCFCSIHTGIESPPTTDYTSCLLSLHAPKSKSRHSLIGEECSEFRSRSCYVLDLELDTGTPHRRVAHRGTHTYRSHTQPVSPSRHTRAHQVSPHTPRSRTVPLWRAEKCGAIDPRPHNATVSFTCHLPLHPLLSPWQPRAAASDRPTRPFHPQAFLTHDMKSVTAPSSATQGVTTPPGVLSAPFVRTRREWRRRRLSLESQDLLLRRVQLLSCSV